MHLSSEQFFQKVRKDYPLYFWSPSYTILEVGSADINGSTRNYFSGSHLGLDVAPGKGVDRVGWCHELDLPPFNVVYSLSALEHDPHWEKTLPQMAKLTTPGGLMFFTCSHTFPEHGTPEHDPGDSLTTIIGINFYKSFDAKDVFQVLDIDKYFSPYIIGVEQNDLVFWGLKK